MSSTLAPPIIGHYKHSVGNGYKAFPCGVFYGTINGHCVTAPCSSGEDAMLYAKRALADAIIDQGSLIPNLTDHIDCLKRNIANGHRVDNDQALLQSKQDFLIFLQAWIGECRGGSPG